MNDDIDTRYLETLLGYNTRRASLTIISRFMERMAVFELRPVDFSVLSLIGHNPGITSRQLCSVLNILPPNLVGFLKAFEKRQLIERKPHPTDGRAVGLFLTESGSALMREAEATAEVSDLSTATNLTATERKTLTRLLQKIYLPN
ncbi:MarR family winged helix-turn-helix transcriptional regulator [Limnohabitans sp. B9-3]|uniref:MarR family winged helix-turn-helix transcriptional regulator n=1 Tax=Limnohabitans sp. B9-3 TaxID=1100707 RepID=UPI000C1F1B6D|nr:MarR family winged helix-turn-helix transcriptional regulator [Limnohabitans sp. B9-3]PIT73776.1 MarR family transcriptional regulator [Limnohabitans sp. B9-3]